MADTLTKAARSELMSRIKCRDTGPEVALHKLLLKLKVEHQMHPQGLPGNPDLVVRHLIGESIAVFVHGCFWHRCAQHFRLPKSRTDHWRQHIGKNVARHRKNADALRRRGYRVAVVWEHELPRKKKGKKLEAE
jgi:DNA mismatch endonuclease (patch repair protein)